jgi:type IV pilus assembly protein PilP
MTGKMNNLSYLLILLLIAGFAGCGVDLSAPQKPVARKPAPKPFVTPVVVQKAELKVEREVYDYDPKGRRDPFKSLIIVQEPKAKKKIGLTPIENFDVDEIKLIAIVWDNRQYYAMVTLPDNKSYTITRDMTLGLYGGKVKEITENSVLIREQVKDYRGKLRIKDTILKLRKEGEE